MTAPDDHVAKHYRPLRPDLFVIPSIEMGEIYPDVADPGWFAVGAEAEFVPEEQRYVLSRIEILRPPERGGLNAVDLREIPVMAIVGSAIISYVHVQSEAGPVLFERPDGTTISSLQGSDRLLAIARQYAIARAVGRSPLKDVAEWMGVSQSTATRWVSKARAAGLL